MRILIADDKEEARHFFANAITLARHEALMASSLSELDRILSMEKNEIDILYLDNHFADLVPGRPAEYGIHRIPELRRRYPMMDIVITTQQSVQPADIPIILEQRVGFLPKPALAADIEADIAARVARMHGERQRQLDLLQRIRDSNAAGEEGIGNLLRFFRRKRAGLTVEIVSLARLEGREVIVPAFEHFLNLHAATPTKYHHEFSMTVDEHIKVSTKFGIGLSLKDSAEFFASSLGIEMKANLERESAFSSGRVIRWETKVDRKFAIGERELNRGITKMEFWRGCLHAVWVARVRTVCDCCGDEQQAAIQILIPNMIVEATVSRDHQGRVVDDGRMAYKVFDVIGDSNFE